MRFTVGQEYVFMRELFKPARPRFSQVYLPWEDTLEAVEILLLTCDSHHKVAWDQDPDGEKKYDGFLFMENKPLGSTMWANQYPSAGYGQLDDSNDRMVRRYPEDEDTFWKPFTLATQVLGSMSRALNPRPHRGEQELAPGQKKLLQEHLDYCVSRIEDPIHGNKRVHFHPAVLQHTDGGFTVLDGYRTATIL